MKKQTYTVTVETDDQGLSTMTSINDGFNTLELLGVLSYKVKDICDQLEGKVEPAKIIRHIVGTDKVVEEDQIIPKSLPQW